MPQCNNCREPIKTRVIETDHFHLCETCHKEILTMNSLIGASIRGLENNKRVRNSEALVRLKRSKRK